MIKLLPILEELNKPNKILVPRRLEDRQAKRLQNDLRKIDEYIKQGSEGDLDLYMSPITKLPDNLVKVGGDLDLSNSKIQDLNNLKEVDGNLDMYDTPINELPDNLTVGGEMYLSKTNLNSLPNNLNAKWWVDVSYTNISEISKNMHIAKSLIISNTPLAQQYTKEQIKQMVIDKGGSVEKIHM